MEFVFLLSCKNYFLGINFAIYMYHEYFLSMAYLNFFLTVPF